MVFFLFLIVSVYILNARHDVHGRHGRHDVTVFEVDGVV